MKPRFLPLTAMLGLTILCSTFSSFASANAVSPTVKSSQINSKKLMVLAYHEVTSEKDSLIPDYSVTTQEFESHIKWLKANGFQFVNVDQVLDAERGIKVLPNKSVLLTFDDGYQSFYDHAYPIIQKYKVPAVLSVVGAWLQPQQNQIVQFGDAKVRRNKLLSWKELQEMQKSGLVEIGSHSYNLHRGVLGNPQGNNEPAAVTRIYQQASKTYESDSAYAKRIEQDLKTNNNLLKQHGIKSPRVMTWPYGRYNQQTVDIAKRNGMPITLSLDDTSIANNRKFQQGQFSRILVQQGMTSSELAEEIKTREMGLGDQYRAQKVMHVDLDYIYDPDPKQQEKNLGLLIDRIVAMNVNTVYLQAFSDPDGNGSADLVYFPNRYIPMRTDLFNRVSWQIQTRTQVSRVYAWMPVFAWELPKNNPVSKQVVVTQQSQQGKHLNMGYHRLSPFSNDARKTIKGIYQDLGKSASFDGIIFHDDATLSDYEDASPEALKAYSKAGLPTDLAAIRNNEKDMQKWTAFKTRQIDSFAMELANEVRYYQPFLLTARNLYAQVALSAYAENWYSQSLEESLKHYDFTAIMAMPYMEQVEDPYKFYQDIINRVEKYPDGMRKTVFELQSVNWRNNTKVPNKEMADTIRYLYKHGVKHVGYYPDDPIEGHPDPAVLREVFDTKPNRLVP